MTRKRTCSVSSEPEAAVYWEIKGGMRLTCAPFLVAGIVNVTPDSFSDGGQFASYEKACERVRAVAEEGAHMVDLGAESTRPGAVSIGHEAEWERLQPVLDYTLELQLKKEHSFAVSVDTFRAATAQKLFEGSHSVDIINDVSGGTFEPEMVDIVATYKPGYVLGHSPARPDVMQKNPVYEDIVETLLTYFTDRLTVFVKAGVPEDCICLDPCIGFGKTPEHALAIFRAVPRFLTLGRPLYFGISRKSFLGSITGTSVSQRAVATQVAVALLATKGVHIHRVHDVAATVQTLELAALMA